MLTIDTRTGEQFIQGHIPGSIFVGLLGGNFQFWFKQVVTALEQQYSVVSALADLHGITVKLVEMGYRNFVIDEKSPHLCEPFVKSHWLTQSVPNIKPLELKSLVINPLFFKTFALKNGLKHFCILDVREEEETKKIRWNGSENLPLSEILMGAVPSENRDYYVHCAGGYRSLIAISYLNYRQLFRLTNIENGMDA